MSDLVFLTYMLAQRWLPRIEEKIHMMKYLPLTLCVIVLTFGIAAALAWGLAPPPWLAGLEAACLLLPAVVYGFGVHIPNVGLWLWLRPIRGTVLVTLGIAAMYVPPSLIVAAYLIGAGVRLVWLSACDLAEREKLQGPQTQLQEAEPGRRACLDEAARHREAGSLTYSIPERNAVGGEPGRPGLPLRRE